MERRHQMGKRQSECKRRTIPRGDTKTADLNRRTGLALSQHIII